MAKNKKKIIAIVSALALLVAAVPVMSQATGVDSDNDAHQMRQVQQMPLQKRKKRRIQTRLKVTVKLFRMVP